MATKTTRKTKTKKSSAPAARVRRTKKEMARMSRPQKAADRLRETWSQTVASLASAEVAVEKQVRRLLQRNRISTQDASTLLEHVNALVSRERKVVARMAGQAAQSALATFNIPSRQEVQELTRKVDQLSRKIDSVRG